MSRSEADAPRITVDVRAQPATEIFLVDHAFQLCGRGIGRLRAELPAGLYKVKYRLGSTIHEELHTIEPTTRALTIHAPKLRFSSPAPLSGTLSTTPEHERAARALSREVHGRVGSGSQLFLFVRGGLALRAGGSGAGTGVHDLSGRLLVPVDDLGASGSGPGGAWTGCTVDLDPGPYRLRMRRPGWDEVEQVVVACSGWQTQVFVDQDDDVAGPDDVSVFMRRAGVGFDPGAEDSRLAELVRIALMNRRRVLDGSSLERLESGEYEDAMLGLYAAHQLVSEGHVDPARLANVVERLRELLGAHPDVDALALLTGSGRPQELATPPMLASSWALLVAGAIDHPSLVPEHSLAARVAGALWGSGCWLMWLPGRLAGASQLDVPMGEAIERVAEIAGQRDAAPPDAALDPGAGLTDLEEAVWSQFARRSASRSATGGIEPPGAGSEEDIAVTQRRLAKSMAVPPATLGATVAGLLGKLEPGAGKGPASG